MNRIRRLVRNPDRGKLLVPFFTAGYPTLHQSLDLVKAAVDNGADMVELGMPFSDPLADGPSIQYSSHEALQQGISLKKILAGVGELRRSVDVPLILMGYYNPIHAFGPERFLRACARAGVDGLIIPDLAVDEAGEYRDSIAANDLSALFLIAPTSSPERITMIDKASTDLVYAVTVTGVTGAGKVFTADTDTYLKYLKKVLIKPFVAGFGVSSPETAVRMCRHADGVVIGSALVEIVRESSGGRKAAADVGNFLSGIARAIK